MNVEPGGTPAYLSDIGYGDFFFAQIGDRIRGCVKAFRIENDLDVIDYIVSFTRSYQDEDQLPVLIEARSHMFKTGFRVSNTLFRHIASENSMLMKTEYWPTPGIVIENPEGSFLTIKSGRLPHKIIYMNLNSGELVFSAPKTPFVYVVDWKISHMNEDVEHVLVQFPFAKETVFA